MKFLTIVTIAAAALLAAALAYPHGEEEEMAHHGGMGHNNHWTAPEEAASRSNPVEASELSLTRGAEAYRANCVSCHGTEARGDGQLAAHLNPAPADLVMMAPMHPAGDLAWKIEVGRGAMPAWKGLLSEEQVWDIVNYLKSLAANDSEDDSGDDSGEGMLNHQGGEPGDSHSHGNQQEHSH